MTDTNHKSYFFKNYSLHYYTQYYCEENVWHLANTIKKNDLEQLENCYVVFLSNENKTVALWKQKAGDDNKDKLVIWDYHVIFIHKPDSNHCYVYDFDSELEFPTEFMKYVTETFRTLNTLHEDLFRQQFRVISAAVYLEHFASDRRHMLQSDGTWLKPPPNYTAIRTLKAFVTFLEDFKIFIYSLDDNNNVAFSCEQPYMFIYCYIDNSRRTIL